MVEAVGPPVRVSAVITAHRRSQYLGEAIESALRAGADEILVVRDYAEPVLGVEGRFTDVLETGEETGMKQAAGLERATGEVVAFLDDDDTWYPDKVGWLRERWRTTQDLVFLCHGQTPVDAAHRPVAARHPEWEERHRSGERSVRSTRGLGFREAHDRYWPGNNSSTVVARSWALRFLPDLRRAGWGCDTFWLVACYGSDGLGLLTAEPKTYLRLHAENMSQTRGSDAAGFRARHREMSSRFARAMDAMATMVGAERPPRERAALASFLHAAADGWGLYRDVEAGSVRRARALRLVFSPEAMRGVRGTAALASVSPALARWALYRASRRRWRLS